MDALTTGDMFLFEDFRLDRSGVSRRDQSGTFVPILIGSRALEILAVLVARQGELVTREEIVKEVWPRTIVEYSNLPVQIAALCRILDRDRQNGSCIQTVAGRGYRFVAPVTPAETVTAAPISRSPNGAGAPIAADEGPELPSALCPIDGLSPAPKPGAPPRRRHAVIASITAGAVCLAVTVVAAMNWHSLSRWADSSAPRLSIVVLPFANLSNDPDQQYFADGITEDLTTDLSRISDMFVISRNTAFTYRNKPVDVKQIGRELGVRYLLEERPALGEPAPRQRRADRRWDRRAPLGGSVRPRHRRPVRLAKRNHEPDREHPRHRADCCGGHPTDRASRCARLHSPRARRRVEAAVARELCRAD